MTTSGAPRNDTAEDEAHQDISSEIPSWRRDFMLFLAGQSISMAGNGIYQVGLAWSVYQLTGSTAAMGIVLTANTVPWLALVLLGGTLADRFPRRLVVLTADSAAALITWTLAVISLRHGISMPILIAAASLLGVVTAFYRPAYSAMNRDLVPESGLRKANAWLGASGNVAYVLGPAVGGAAYALGGSGLVFILDAASFSVAAGAMLFTKTRPKPAGNAHPQLLGEISAGLKYMARTPWLSVILLISLIANFACLAPYVVLLPALVRAAGSGSDILGLLTSAEVLTTIAATMYIGRLRTVSAGSSLLLLTSAIGAGTIVLGLAGGHLAAMLPGVILIGVGYSYDVIENTVIQSQVPEEFLSRVYSVDMIASFGLLPLGYTSAGLLARSIGTSWVLAGGGAIMVISCTCARTWRPARSLLSGIRMELKS